jgi:hypothetical protein
MPNELGRLRRVWLETPTPDAGIALLDERRRLGELGEANLRLAAYLGGALSPKLLPGPVEAPSSLEAWVRGLDAWGTAAEVRAGLAAARVAIPLWEKAKPRSERPSRTIRALEAWVEAPSDGTLAHVGKSRFEVNYWNATAAVAAKAVVSLATAVSFGDEPLSACALLTATVVDPLLVRKAISHELANWALGYAGAELVPPPVFA